MDLAKIYPATIEHAQAIAPVVRQADIDEVWASSLSTPLRAMTSGIKYSKESFTGFVGDKPVCMWGVVQESLVGNIGVPWMIATEYLEKFDRVFIRHCKAQALEIFNRYDTLINHVDARNKKAIRWLKWIGFTVETEAKPYGIKQLPFHKFVMQGEKCAIQ